ncbi:MAG: Crp/Fnr family transcriptional regulator [Acidobacteria bacterium]|nr:Crp/Fnr family transcriptional regulator [Acidobacteriota bacterium]MBK8151507.1 Crp/Fnr family transcriptional regulator [Acidobacteriota bacterium]MBK8812626.1 Crp/Fnr family transcriptional regulator [Acidobacteriota bacterium]
MKLDINNNEYLPELKKRGRTKVFQPGEEIFAEGEDALHLPIVLSGKVKMVRYPEVGKEIIIGIFSDGQMFAVPPVFDGGPYPASAIAMDESRLLIILRNEFLAFVREHPDFSVAVINWMCGMLREKTSVIKNLATASPEHRVGNVLIQLLSKETEKNGGPIRISLRRQDIAEMAGLTTETTIRATRKLAERGLLRIVHGKIYVDDAKELGRFLKN